MAVRRTPRTDVPPDVDEYLDKDDDSAEEAVAASPRVTRRTRVAAKPEPEPEPDDDGDDEPEPEPAPPVRRRRAVAKPEPEPEPDDDDDDADDEPEPAPPVRRLRAAKPEPEPEPEPEPPVRRRRAAKPEPDPEPDDDDADDEPEPPVRRRRAAKPEPEPAPPVRRRRAEKPEPEPEYDDDDYDDDDDDEDDEIPTIPTTSGWGTVAQAARENQHEFRVTEERQLIKFVSGEPTRFKQHWLEKEGKKSYSCIGSKTCPICRKLGDTPQSKFIFTVVGLSDIFDEDNPDAPVDLLPQVLVAGTRLAGQLEALQEDPRTGPLSKHYYAISRTGGGAKNTKRSGSASTIDIQVVKERDLLEDWDVDPAEIKPALAKIKQLGPDVLGVSTVREMEEIAREMLRPAPRARRR